MKSHVLLIIGLALSVAACDNAVETKSYQYEGILRHAHKHADQLDLLNDALANGDLAASKLPARWLERHDTMIGVPEDWQPYRAEMRDAARAVESATDIEVAVAASLRISEQCQNCHTAAGIIN